MPVRFISFVLALMLFAFSFAFFAKAETPEYPSVSARSAVLIDASDVEHVIFEKNPCERLPMASTTKIMTVTVALEYADPGSVVTVPREAVGIEGSSVYLTEGEKLTLGELLYAVMLCSANDAAAAVAIYVGGSVEGFSELMNGMAEKLGLHDTHFVTPHGLDAEGHYTTALDLARLTAYALGNGTFRKLSSTYKYEIPGPGGKRLLVNHNKLLRSYEGCIGVKTGYTKKCGRCLVSAAERGGLTLVAVTLSAPDDWRDHTAMLDYGFACYEAVTLASAGQRFYMQPDMTGSGALIECVAHETVTKTLQKYGGEITATVECGRYSWRVPENGERVGRVVFSRGGKTIEIVELYARVFENETGKTSILQKIFNKK